ncbi:Cna B-type domain-containing protein, partial [Peptostreptococcus russellii]|uniref:Cna B-type domain-containing protein n=1 Tax=Peptostreptococcus russellii TaxID=215200 RepID=UPI003F5805A3
MFKKITTIFMATLIFINSIFLSSQNMNVNAQGDIIKSVKFERNDLSHMEVTGISVEFGGIGTKVSSGQTETIRFDGNNAKLEMPKNPIELKDGAGYSLGRVEFSQGSATIIFNDYAASLDDVEGRFDFNATAVYQGDQSQPGSGDITANYGYNTEKATVNYSGAGGTETSNVYSKKGVTSIDNPDKVDWVFSLNMAQKSVNYPGEQVSYIITDTLDDTMEWDLDAINSNPYVVNFEGGYTSTIFGTWVSLERAKELGIKVNMTGQKLYIEVPPAFNNGSGWFSSLDQTAISIRLSSKIKDEVMNDTSVKYVDNSSDVVINGADDSWKINPEDTSDSVKILRQGGSAYGTKPGELKIFKTIENKKIGIKDVTFELKRNDGKDIVIAGDNKGKSIEIKTDGNGLANIKGLPVATYIVKEKSAPSWIEFNERESIEETFEVKSTDKDGTLLEISNKKKKIDINVEKKWNTDLKDLPEVRLNLLKDGVIEGEEILLKDGKTSHQWKDLDLADDYGKEYEYTVKEVGEENGKIVLDGKSYKVDVSGNMKSGYVITNTQDKPLIPLEPALRSIKVSKDWKDSEGKVIDPKVESIMVELYKNGSATGNKLELSKENNWSAEFTKLKVSETVGGENNDYTVKEVNGEDGKIKIADKWYKVSVSGNMSEGFKIVNTQNRPLIPIEPALRSIKVSKDWKDSEGKVIDPKLESIMVELYKNGSATGNKLELNKENNWSGEFVNLKYSDALALGEHNYTVKEVG